MLGVVVLGMATIGADVPSSGTQVFGIAIGTKFDVPKCVGKDAEYKGTKVTCWEASVAPGGPKPNGEVVVVFPAKQAPAIAKGTSITVTVFDGLVKGVAFVTHGAF